MDAEENIKIYFKEEQWDKLSEFEKTRYKDTYNMYHGYLLQGVVLPKPDFIISNEENAHETVNKTEDMTLPSFEEVLLPDNFDIKDDLMKEETTEILISDINKYSETTVKEEVADVCVCSLCCIEFSSVNDLKEHETKCLHKIPEEYSSEEMLQCPGTNKKNLEIHMEHCCGSTNETRPLDALDIERFPSTLSEYQTKSKGDLAKQYQMHDDVKLGESAFCNKELTKNSNLKAFLRTPTGVESMYCGNLIKKNDFCIEKKFQHSECKHQPN